jgi:hypothetical protein
MNFENLKPLPGEIAEAKRWPNGWVYRIAGQFRSDERIPAEAIVGAWQVDSQGKIVGNFVPNKKYNAERWPSGQDNRS